MALGQSLGTGGFNLIKVKRFAGDCVLRSALGVFWAGFLLRNE